jgi:hypothetical protein
MRILIQIKCNGGLSWLNLKHESKGGERGREKRRGSFTG